MPIREIKCGDRPPAGRKRPWPTGADAAGPLLNVAHITKTFSDPQGRRPVRAAGGGDARHAAVDDVSFEIRRGECLGLVGESRLRQDHAVARS